MSNLNLKYTPNEKPRTGRTAPSSIYGRKLFELPDTEIVDDYPEIKRSYNVRIKQGNTYVSIHQAVKKKKKKQVNAPQVSMRRFADSCRDETGN